MPALQGFAVLLLCQSMGVVVARLAQLSLPGPVIGLVLLLALLALPAVRAPVEAAADALLSHLSLLFVPAGVGVVTHLALLSEYGLRMLAVVVLSTWAGMAASAWALRAQLRRSPAGTPG